MNVNVVLIAGSSRTNSQTAKVALYLGQRLKALDICTAPHIIDLARSPLPLWPGEDLRGIWADHAEVLREADAVVVLAPEWHGMAAPAIKNLFMYASYKEVGHKPALLVSISSGQGGAYPLSELRASSYKNNRVCYLPEHLIVRQVEGVMNAGEAQTADDLRIRQRADWTLQILGHYAQAMQPLRGLIAMDNTDFANGM
ncbi:NAD(P)H-dependent oxidoreductase [Pseudomonas capsici]|uniref:NADPH-dependent FMN reductase n=1 Tax=Pseudomonas capsici TaxID=2810614 RepID=UPI000E3DFD5E|nr:NAD(P)H-dependent oxidoreductase [Pseudomonas capsici]MBX8475267.1 NAD(P)H-dependent oxidoreductase [Pseudomonas cichorii]MBN6713642.1 NAD(P)H-dependent oxidoreductase [Pseudomonas capsici]MBN6718796.1 NAD(P)H-dependent oxidoreductase [Pseudomonas capsici]MBN6724828.1 NAD(P)H-dependent oxidoreductase [Pseudomonas capsici]MBX8606054.1 NAD(P)H-dependent oxidoreductase [Pseudomonas cichorii]